MRKTTLAILCLLASSPAGAASWSVGSNVGVFTIRSERPGSGSTTVVAWPSSELVYQPAMRLGVGNRLRSREILFESGFLFLDQAGSSLSFLSVTVAYQHVFRPSARFAPFGNLAAGIYREGSSVQASTSGMYGAGLGVRRVVGDLKGDFRAELRVDRLNSDDSVGRPALNFVGLRLGFDLWL